MKVSAATASSQPARCRTVPDNRTISCGEFSPCRGRGYGLGQKEGCGVALRSLCASGIGRARPCQARILFFSNAFCSSKAMSNLCARIPDRQTLAAGVNPACKYPFGSVLDELIAASLIRDKYPRRLARTIAIPIQGKRLRAARSARTRHDASPTLVVARMRSFTRRFPPNRLRALIEDVFY